MLRISIGYVLILSPIIATGSECSGEEMSTGWCYPTGTSSVGDYLDWHKNNPDPRYANAGLHLAKDIKAKQGDPVFAIADGSVLIARKDVGGYANVSPGGGMIIRHRTKSGEEIDVLYAHVKNMTQNKGVVKGQRIADIGPYDGGSEHLHFAIAAPKRNNANYSGGGSYVVWDGYAWDDEGFVDPFKYLYDHEAGGNSPVTIQTTCSGVYCWAPQGSSCEHATSWYRLDDIPKVQSKAMCSEMYSKLVTISQNPNPQQEVPEEKWWQSWWKFLKNIFGPNASASTIQNFTVPRTIEISIASSGNSHGAVRSGAGKVLSDSNSPGAQTIATDVLVPTKPDFIIDRSRLFKDGVEQYVFNTSDTMCMEAKLKNIGQGKIGNSDIVRTRFLLSKGYKEDPHGEWIGIGSFDTRGDHVEQGESHTETVCVSLADKPYIVPGRVYNIIAYADRTEINNNDGGKYQEEHENNNASSETVFSVKASYNLALSNLVLPKNQFSPGETISASVVVHNLLDELNEVAQVAFFLSPDQDWNHRMLADTKTIQVEILPPQSAVAVSSNNLVAPAPGEYTLWACVNPNGSIPETNGEDNCQSLWFEVLDVPPQPQPDGEEDDAIITIIQMMM